MADAYLEDIAGALGDVRRVRALVARAQRDAAARTLTPADRAALAEIVEGYRALALVAAQLVAELAGPGALMARWPVADGRA
jgi:hypothetical protein